jgi:hypothetical protein
MATAGAGLHRSGLASVRVEARRLRLGESGATCRRALDNDVGVTRRREVEGSWHVRLRRKGFGPDVGEEVNGARCAELHGSCRWSVKRKSPLGYAWGDSAASNRWVSRKNWSHFALPGRGRQLGAILGVAWITRLGATVARSGSRDRNGTEYDEDVSVSEQLHRKV